MCAFCLIRKRKTKTKYEIIANYVCYGSWYSICFHLYNLIFFIRILFVTTNLFQIQRLLVFAIYYYYYYSVIKQRKNQFSIFFYTIRDSINEIASNFLSFDFIFCFSPHILLLTVPSINSYSFCVSSFFFLVFFFLFENESRQIN